MSKPLNGARVARLQQLHNQVQTLKSWYVEMRAALLKARRELAQDSEGLDATLVSLLVRSG